MRDSIEARLTELVAGIASAWGMTIELDYERSYPVTVNDAEKVAEAARAATEVAGAANVATNVRPGLGGEDFAFMLERCPGAIIFAGNGPSAGLHHPKYDFNDALIPWGCSYWTALASQRLS